MAKFAVYEAAAVCCLYHVLLSRLFLASTEHYSLEPLFFICLGAIDRSLRQAKEQVDPG